MDLPAQARLPLFGVDEYIDTDKAAPRVAPEPLETESDPSHMPVGRSMPNRSHTGERHPVWKSPLDTVIKTIHDMIGIEQTEPGSRQSTNGATAPARLCDCLNLLEYLQETLQQEFLRIEKVERDARTHQTDLARIRSALVGTRNAARQARHDSMHDELTGLPNRTHFLRQLNQSLADSDPSRPALAVVFIDLDGFKSVNDTNGHLIGDAFLRITATRLARMVRTEDTMSRFGGDEFVCLIRNAGRDQLAHLADKLRTAISQPVRIDTLALAVNPSIGISVFPENGTTADQLLSSADEAMYHAKRNTLGIVFHDSPNTVNASSPSMA